MDDYYTRLSKTISHALRHKPEEYNPIPPEFIQG